MQGTVALVTLVASAASLGCDGGRQSMHRRRDPGALVVAQAADVQGLDPVRVQDKSTYAQPHQYSQGFDVVLVNGQIVVDGGKLTAARPGQPLRHKP